MKGGMDAAVKLVARPWRLASLAPRDDIGGDLDEGFCVLRRTAGDFMLKCFSEGKATKYAHTATQYIQVEGWSLALGRRDLLGWSNVLDTHSDTAMVNPPSTLAP